MFQEALDCDLRAMQGIQKSPQNFYNFLLQNAMAALETEGFKGLQELAEAGQKRCKGEEVPQGDKMFGEVVVSGQLHPVHYHSSGSYTRRLKTVAARKPQPLQDTNLCIVTLKYSRIICRFSRSPHQKQLCMNGMLLIK